MLMLFALLNIYISLYILLIFGELFLIRFSYKVEVLIEFVTIILILIVIITSNPNNHIDSHCHHNMIYFSSSFFQQVWK